MQIRAICVLHWPSSSYPTSAPQPCLHAQTSGCTTFHHITAHLQLHQHHEAHCVYMGAPGLQSQPAVSCATLHALSLAN